MRKIALLDLDAFFASAEVLRDPSLKNRPFAVGGGGVRGVVATANYLARQFGVRSAMPGSQARRLCPHLHFVTPDHAYYRSLSKQVLECLHEVTDLVEPASIDEFYLDLTDNTQFQGSATLTMEAVRASIRELGISGSAGISNQKMVAKIASEERKPDGQFLVAPEQVYAYLGGLSLKKIPGVGPKSLDRLQRVGFHTGADVQAASMSDLQAVLGEKAGWLLHQRCAGIDNREVITERVRKSVGVEETLEIDFQHVRQAEQFLERFLLPKLQRRLGGGRWQDTPIKTQTVKIKFQDFNQTTVSKARAVTSPSLFYQLLNEAWARRQQRAVRLIGISVALPEPNEQYQLELDLD